MSDELRDRLSQIIDRGLYCWDSDTKTSMTDTEYAAQAIIDDLGLEVETLSEKAIGHMVRPAQYRVVGKWVAHP